MYRRPLTLTVFYLLAAMLPAFPDDARAGRIWDCLFGNAPPPQTTYAPAFVPTSAAPACTPICAPMCQPVCTPCGVPQSCQPVSATVYSPVIRTAYSPVYRAAFNPVYPAVAVTTYRPFLGTYQTRLVPYTNYRPIYVPAVSYQSGYLPACPSPCGVSRPSYSSYGVVESGCSSCAPAPAMQQAPAAAQPSAPQTEPKTFRESERPASNDDLRPIPVETQFNSTPAPPLLPDPNNRTAARPVILPASHTRPIARPAPTAPERNDGGWYGAD